MRSTLTLSLVAVLSTLATVASAQQDPAGFVDVVALASNAKGALDTVSKNPMFEKSLSRSVSTSGGVASSSGSAYASAGYVATGFSANSGGNPYAAGSGRAYYADSIKLRGTEPMKVKLRMIHFSGAFTSGSDAMQPDAASYAYMQMQGTGVNVWQSGLVNARAGTSGGFSDIEMTLQPNQWYRLLLETRAYGDTADETSPFTSNNATATSALTAWFEQVPSGSGLRALGSSAPFLESASGHHYMQAVPEPGSMIALAVGAVGLLRRRAKHA